MPVVALTLAAALALVAAVVFALRRTYVQRSLGWRLLAHAGWPLILAGTLFVARFWTPTPGPYLANTRYPFGDHLAAWAVSFGFTWIAFGLLFAALAVLAPAPAGRAVGADVRPGRLAWLALVAAWALCWLPHGIIGVAVAVGGLEAESVTRYATWAGRPLGTLTLAADSVLLALHVGCSLAGFVVAGREVWRTPDEPTGPAPVSRAA
jgi:hypothetical protein